LELELVVESNSSSKEDGIEKSEEVLSSMKSTDSFMKKVSSSSSTYRARSKEGSIELVDDILALVKVNKKNLLSFFLV
jgi:hypothetical protein